MIDLDPVTVIPSRPRNLRDLSAFASQECQERVSEARTHLGKARASAAQLQTPLVTNGLRGAVDDIVELLADVDDRFERLAPQIERHFAGRDDG